MQYSLLLLSLLIVSGISGCSDNDQASKTNSSPSVKENPFTEMVNRQQQAMKQAKEVEKILKDRSKALDKQLN